MCLSRLSAYWGVELLVKCNYAQLFEELPDRFPKWLAAHSTSGAWGLHSVHVLTYICAIWLSNSIYPSGCDVVAHYGLRWNSKLFLMAKEGKVLNQKYKNCTTKQLSSRWLLGEVVSSYEVNPLPEPRYTCGTNLSTSQGCEDRRESTARAGHARPEMELATSRSLRFPLASSCKFIRQGTLLTLYF